MAQPSGGGDGRLPRDRPGNSATLVATWRRSVCELCRELRCGQGPGCRDYHGDGLSLWRQTLPTRPRSRRWSPHTEAELGPVTILVNNARDDPGRRDRVADQVRLRLAAYRTRAALNSSRTASKTRARARPAGTSLPP